MHNIGMIHNFPTGNAFRKKNAVDAVSRMVHRFDNSIIIITTCVQQNKCYSGDHPTLPSEQKVGQQTENSAHNTCVCMQQVVLCFIYIGISLSHIFLLPI